MKKILKIIGLTLGGIIVLIVIAVGIVQLKPLPTYEVKDTGLKVEVTPERVHAGAVISASLCAVCHMAEDGTLGGRLMEEAEGFGKIYAANISQHKVYGIGEYTDGELFYLLRTGIKRDGHLALPMMFRSLIMSDEDIFSLIAFLRSDDPQVQPSENVIPAYQQTFLSRMLFNLAFKPLPWSGQPVVAPDKTDEIAYGKYLVQGRHVCFDCHSGGFETNDPINPENSVRYLGGGATFHDLSTGETIVMPNITPDPEHGIGDYSLEEFITAVKYGRNKEGRMLRFPMPPFAGVDSTDITAIYRYIQTVPPLGPQAEKSEI
ncbi:MAG: cytochrome c [Bacteroidia bacterium]